MKPLPFYLIVVAAAVAGPQSLAQGPERPLRIVVGYPAGTPPDVVARPIAEKLRQSLGQPVIVENKAGADGRIGAEAVSKARADGNTILLTPSSPIAMHPHMVDSLPYDPRTDLAPIAGVATLDFGLAVKDETPATTLQEYLRLAKAERRYATYGTPAAGSAFHFMGVLLAKRSGIELTHVPYKGSPQAVGDLIGGQIGAVITVLAGLVEQHRAGKVRVLAVSGSTRSPILPDVPTLTELGYDIDLRGWYGVFAPSHTPHEAIERLNRAIVQALNQADVRDNLLKLGLQPITPTVEEFATTVRNDYEMWGHLIADARFKIDQ
jgi:tripartite-type tricarboxylate transporter receptor subunit TctC